MGIRPGAHVVALMILLVAIAGLRAAAGGQAPVLSDRAIQVSGTSVHIRCGGERTPGAPLVVLEAGAFNTVDTWRDVQGPVAAFARVCAHDRPGRGASGPAPDGLDGPGLVALTRGLLREAGEPPPYVLVGHSLGGLIAQIYVSRYPEDVAGLVLVDSSHADQLRRMAAVAPRTPPAPPSTGRPAPAPEAVPIERLVEALPGARWTFNGPLVVLTRGRWTAGIDGPDDRARLAAWGELQRDLATRSPRSEQIVASGSGHYIQNDEPRLVIEAVRRLVSAR